MDNKQLKNLAQRFVQLESSQQIKFLAGMRAQGIDPNILPIPQKPNRVNTLPPSFSQQRQWFLWQLNPESDAYHIKSSLKITGVLDLIKVQASLGYLIERHVSLRTVFKQDSNDSMQQVILNKLDITLEHFDLRNTVSPEEAALKTLIEQGKKGFDLNVGPLWRVVICQAKDNEYFLLVVMHHIISDGWSMEILVREFMAYYQLNSQNNLTSLATLDIDYTDYSHWQHTLLDAGELEKQLDYWKSLFADEQDVLMLPTDYVRKKDVDYQAVDYSFVISEELTKKIQATCKHSNMTSFNLLLACFQLLLHKCSGKNQINVGVANANRNKEEIEGIIGFFVNTLVYSATFSSESTFESVLSLVNQRCLEAQENQTLPFDILVDSLNIKRSLDFNPLFQVMFDYQIEDEAKQLKLKDLTIEDFPLNESVTQFDLELNVLSHINGQITATFSYAKELFNADTIARLSDYYIEILQAFVDTPKQPIGELNLLTDREQQQLHHWGVKPFTADSSTPVHILFEQQANKTPEAMALTFEQEVLNYNTLNKRVNQLAHTLIAKGVQPEDKVGIAVERSVDMVVSLLAVLKAGGAFVPLDPTYPKERLAYMIEDSGLHVLLTQHHLLSGLPANNVVTLHCLDTVETVDSLQSSEQFVDNPRVSLSPDNLAYLIYTSGSTGRPKAVAVSHAGFSAHVHVTCDFFSLVPNDHMLQFSTINFDGFIEQLFPPLTLGAGLVLRGKDIWDAETFYQQLICHQISVIDLPTAYWFMLVQHFAEHNIKEYGCLREVHLGGEAMPPEGVNAWRAANLSHVTLLNTYGPTEAVVTASVSDCQPYVDGQTLPANMPIGRPLGGRHLYVVDSDLNLTPQGVAGELCIGGDLLARGYLGRQDLTASSFIADPFSDTGARLYRTGDLVRWRADGELEYLGRIDHQVKIRGFRIELGEIEAAFLKEAAVTEAIVIAKSSEQGARLIAYVAGNDLANREMSIDGLKTSLSKSLPDHMVPSAIVILGALPLNPSGKIDRHALPEPKFADKNRYEAPIGEVEKQIAAVWSSVLGLEKIGRHDNFFTLGGDSILTLKVVAKASKQALNLTPKMLFEYQTIALLSQALQTSQQTEVITIPVLDQKERTNTSLSFAQSRQWFLWQLSPESTAYHISGALTLTGEVNINAFTDCFTRLIARHEALRTIFKETTDGAAQQVIQAPYVLDIPVVDLRATQGEKQAQAVKAQALAWHGTPFDLTEGPLLRVGLIQRSANEHVLVVVMHHIISDDWSMQILIDEFIDCYQAMLTDNTLSLPALSVQYADYAVWQQAWLAEGELEKQLAYWCDYLGDEQPVLQLPTDHARKVDADYLSASYDIILPEVLSQQLKRYVGAQQSTLFTVFLSAYQVLLSRYTGQADIRVGVPIANRHHRGTDDIMGFFVNTQVLRGVIDQGMTLSNVLANSKTSAFNAQVHQDLPFEKLVEALQPERSLSHTPLFQVMYNHLRNDKDALARLDCFSMEEYVLGEQGAQFELTLDTNEDEVGHLSICFSYAKELFNADTIARLSNYYIEILQAFVADDKQLVRDITLLTTTELKQLNNWGVNSTTENTLPVHIKFEQQAKLQPDATAVVFAGSHLTYAQLSQQANQLAHYLQSSGISIESKIGIALPRSLDTVIALLAVLKAGALFIPLDMDYPAERLAYIIEDSGIDLIISHSQSVDKLPALAPTLATQVCCIDQIDMSTQSRQTPALVIHPKQLAYVIYTSGSTGRPKGAAISHDALSNCMAWMQRQYQPTRDDAVLHKAAFGFDVSCWELFFPLSEGIKLVIAEPGDQREPARLIKLMQQEQVTITNFPPAMQQAFLEQADIEQGQGLRQIMCGGEAVPAELKQQTYELLPNVTMNNLYGPTETTIHVTHWPCANDNRTLLPIGQPISDTKTYVFDSALNPVPQGVAGELYIGGLALGRGYLARPELTADRFIADPLADDGSRLYRTGDLVRWNHEGLLEYLGRIDDQVQIRGFRIELGEIEAQLHRLENIQEAMVIAHNSALGDRLVAYVTGSNIDVDVLGLQLGEILPDYMIPSAFIVLDSMPLSPNGKVDRKALPAPEFSRSRVYEAPEGEVEIKVAEIWSDILNVEQVGRQDNFFELGGHSLLAIKLLDKIRQAGWQAQVKTLFSQPVLKGFAQAIESMIHETLNSVNNYIIPKDCSAITPDMLPLVTLAVEEIKSICAKIPGGVNNVQDIYPLTSLQEGILFHHLLQQEGDAYITQTQVRFDERSALERFINDLNVVISRHDILRSAIFWEGLPEPVQVVQRHAELSINWLAFEDNLTTASEQLTTFCMPEKYRMDLQEAPLLRAIAIQETGKSECWLQLPSHHLIMDHVSLDILVGEIQQIQAGKIENLSAPVPFRQFVATVKQDQYKVEQDKFFTELLGDIVIPTAPFDLLDVHGTGANIDTADLLLSDEFSDKIRQLATQYEVSSAAIFHLAWALVLFKLTGNENPVFGTVLFGRMQAGEHAESAVGMFINTLPIRFRLTDSDLALGLTQTHNTLSELLNYDTASLISAQKCSGISKGMPLFSTLFNYRHASESSAEQGSWQGVELSASEEQTNYPIGISIDDQKTSFNITVQSVDEVNSEQLCFYLQQALSCLVNFKNNKYIQRLCDVDVLNESQFAEQSLWSLNTQKEEYVPVHVQFSQHAKYQPNVEALSFAGEVLSYSELNKKVNRLSHYLITQGMGTESKIAVAMLRSHEMIISLLAIMKVGALYVPLDVDYPEERLNYIIESSRVDLLLSHQAAQDRIPNIVAQSQLWEDFDLSTYSDLDVLTSYHPEQLAYVIYTSGSTGKPKGVAISHRALANCMAWMQRTYKLSIKDVVLHKAPFGFDVSCWEIFWPLSEGIKLVVAEPDDHKDPDRLIALIQQENITTLNFVPAMQQAFLDQVDINQRSSLKHIMVGGEAMPPELKSRTCEILPDANMYNLYGPTEATIHVTSWTCENDNRTIVPIGAPISDTSTYVLDQYLNPVPQGVSGELYLGGVGLARGYLQRPDLTAERFIANPFDLNGSRLYRTGDLVRWNEQGLLEYLGRLDHQVKIRGLRIELGEIEAQLCTLSMVNEAVVIAKSSASGDRLVAFVTGKAINNDILNTALADKLPDYMLPSAYITLPFLPLSPNGKVDRKALPDFEWQLDIEFVEPQNDIELLLANIWSQILGVTKVSRTANFFEIGGDSISCLKVVNLIREQGYILAVKQIFESPVLHELAYSIITNDQTNTVLINDSIVRLNSEIDVQTPIFCLHDGFGKIWDYSRLAQLLNGQRTVYGLPFNANELTEEGVKLHELVELHLAAIRQIQPVGPYHLCGWSFGAIIGHLLVEKLQEQGEQVASLVLLDPYVPPQVGEDNDTSIINQIEVFFSLLLTDNSLQQLSKDQALKDVMQMLITSENLTLSIKQLLALVISHSATDFKQGYNNLNSDELFILFASYQALFLTAVNIQKLPVITTPTQIYWTPDRPDSDKIWWNKWLINDCIKSDVLATDHFQIVRSPEVLSSF